MRIAGLHEPNLTEIRSTIVSDSDSQPPLVTRGNNGALLGAFSTFRDRQISKLRIGDLEVGVIRWGDCAYAVRNICPHQLGPICAGIAVPSLTSSADEDVVVDGEHPVIVCPWHRWEFRLPSGVALRDPRYRLRTYPTWIAGGQVFADLRGRPPR
jgi:nitrite reductase/ring-hydroxylating ferredoxin subunit